MAISKLEELMYGRQEDMTMQKLTEFRDMCLSRADELRREWKTRVDVVECIVNPSQFSEFKAYIADYYKEEHVIWWDGDRGTVGITNVRVIAGKGDKIISIVTGSEKSWSTINIHRGRK